MSKVETRVGFAAMVASLGLALGCNLDNSREITTGDAGGTDTSGDSSGSGGSDASGGSTANGAGGTRATSAGGSTDTSSGGSGDGSGGASSAASADAGGSGGSSSGSGGQGGDSETNQESSTSTSTTGATSGCREPNEDREDACVISDLTTPYSNRSVVNTTDDKRDLYEITMLENGILTYGIDKTNAPVQVQVFEDKMPLNLQMPYDDRIIVPKDGQQYVDLVLEKGTYVIGVLPYGTASPLSTFVVTADYYEPKEPNGEPGSTENALQVPDLDELREYGGYVGRTDSEDDYRVSLPSDGILGVQLEDVTGDVQALILEDTDVLDWTAPLDQTLRAYTDVDPAPLEKTLTQGNYYVRIRPFNANGTNSVYRLTFYDAGAE